MKMSLVRSVAIGAVVAMAAPLLAQAVPAAAPPTAAPPAAPPMTAEQRVATIDTVRAEVAAIRQRTVAQNMTFTDQEATAFWPLYNRYRAEMKTARDIAWQVMLDYGPNYTSMTDTLAQRLVGQFYDGRKKEIDIRLKYAPQFAKAIGWTKTFRFLQIENKLDASQDFNRAKELKLVTAP